MEKLLADHAKSCNHAKPCETKPDVSYGMCKVHKGTKEQLISEMYPHFVQFYQQPIPAHTILKSFLYQY